MMNVVNGEPLPAPIRRTGQGDTEWGSYIPVIFIAALALGGVLRSLLGRFPGSLVMGGVTGLLAWFFIGAFSIAIFAGILALLVTLFSGGARGIGRGYSGGSGGFGGGGGGFGGGGGGFGGGGASGRW